MRVAVTGGSGQLGSLVLKRLAADRSVTEIVAIDLKPPRVASRKLVVVNADIRDPAMARHFEGCDVLVHMAFVVTGPGGKTFDAINIGGSKNVFNAAASAGVKRIVYTSSIAAYGVVTGHPQPIVETTPRVYQPSFAYSAAKYKVEEFLDDFESRNPGIGIVRIRPGILIGAYMEHALGDSLRRRTMVSIGGNNPMPIVWDEDVADAIVLGLKSEVRGAFNLVADDPLPVADLVAAGGLRLVRVPPAALSGAKVVLPVLGRLGIGRASDPAWLDNTEAPMIISSTRARSELSWRPTCPTAADVIRRYVEVVPSRPDPRILLFFRLVGLASRTRELPADTKRMDVCVHLALTGPNGGDFDIRVLHGRLTVRQGVPRPPTVTVTLKASVFLDMIAGRSDYTIAQMTGKIRIEGEALAGMVIQAVVSGFRQQADQAGLRAWPVRQLAAWLARPAAGA